MRSGRTEKNVMRVRFVSMDEVRRLLRRGWRRSPRFPVSVGFLISSIPQHACTLCRVVFETRHPRAETADTRTNTMRPLDTSVDDVRRYRREIRDLRTVFDALDAPGHTRLSRGSCGRGVYTIFAVAAAISFIRVAYRSRRGVKHIRKKKKKNVYRAPRGARRIGPPTVVGPLLLKNVYS